MTRWCRRSSMWMSFSTSPSSRRETGMPVHLPTTSAISSASTLLGQVDRRLVGVLGATRPRRACCSSSRDLAVAQLGGALVVELALGALELACGPRRGARAACRGPRPAPSRAPTGRACRRACSRRSASSRSISSRRSAAVSSLLDGDLLDLELLDAALDLVDLGRDGGQLDRDARGGLVDEVDRLVGQEAVGDVAVARAWRRRSARRR